jgi:nucleotide-binding universal stress UspA family protein
MFQKILLAWDGSRAAVRALDLAVDIARRYDAELCAVGVAHSPAHAETEADRRESADAARRYLEETLAQVRDRADRVGVSLELVVVEGDQPPEDILRHAHEHGFDLVVTGHHRRRRAGRALLHGVAERLVDGADLPVLVVRERNGE